MSFHHLYDLLADMNCQTRKGYRLPLDIGTLVQTSKSKLLKDDGAMGQME